jgi:uncharacterized membrane protein
MAMCPKCGTQVAEGAKFCGSCGAVTEAVAAAPAVSPAPPTLQAQSSSGGAGGIAPNVAAMLTYLPVCMIGLVCAILFGFILEPHKNDRFVRFHAWQSLALQAAFIVFWIISSVLIHLAHGFAVITVPVSMLVGLGALVLMVILMIKAHGRQSYKVPVLGEWAEKQANK